MSYDIAPLGADGAGSGVNRTDPWGYPHLNSVAKYEIRIVVAIYV